MAKKNKGFMGSLSTEKKISLIACLGIFSCAMIFLFTSSSGSKIIGNSSSGTVDVNINTSSANIDQAKFTDEVENESEVINEIFENEKKSRLENAQNSDNVSFIDTLELENDYKMSEEIEGDIEHRRHQQGIDSILAIDNEIEINRQKAEAEERKKRLEQKKSVDPIVDVVEAPVQTQAKPAFFFDKKSFLQGEMQNLSEKKTNTSNANTQAVSMIAETSKTGGTVSGSFSSGSNSSKSGSSKNGGRSATENLKENKYSNVIKAGKQNKYDELNDIRRRNGGVVNNPGGNKSQRDAYIDMADPGGFKDNSTSEYITAGTIYYSILEIGINTDEISPVRAVIIQESPLKGAVLLGSPERRGEKAVIAFNSMSLDGKDYGINGIALDLETMRTGIADSVDHHTFERYSKLMGAAFISGYAESLSNTSTKTYSDGSTEKIVDAIPDVEDQIAYAIGQAGESLTPIFEKEFDRDPTIEVDANREIAIMFMSGFTVGEEQTMTTQ